MSRHLGAQPGGRFSVLRLLSRLRGGRTQTAQPAMETVGSAGGPVLVVTSDSEVCDWMQRELAAFAHPVSCCRSIWSAYVSTARNRPATVVLDWRLPEETPERLLRWLGGTQVDGRRPQHIALVPGDDPEILHRVLRFDADDFLTLPLSTDVLRVRLQIVKRRGQRLQRLEEASHRAVQALERFMVASGGKGEGLWEWDLERDKVWLSDRWLRTVGLQGEEREVERSWWFDRVHREDVDRLQAAIDAAVHDEANPFEQRYRLLHEDGRYRWMTLRGSVVHGSGGEPTRLVGLQADITDSESSGDHLPTSGWLDPLTGLANRAVLEEQLRLALARARRDSSKTFALLFFDVDRFKNVNDSMGHVTGDKLLRAIAERVGQACRPTDTVSRFGGDEFAILVEDVPDVRAAAAVAEKIRREFRVPFDLDGVEVFATVSIGIVFWDPTYQEPEKMLRDSDTAMYRAKALGRNRFAVFDAEMHASVVETLNMENDLRRALARNEFEAYFQPIVSVREGRLTGFEVLARWRHPERGLLNPDQFIPVAEEMGAIIQIDRQAAEEGCRSLHTWRGRFRELFPLMISVNVSSLQFMQPDLVPQIDHILRKWGLYGSSLKIEVTESVLMEHAAYAPAMLEQLRALDIGISIDDFGTGYSSLAYLRRFGVDTLKIDHSFVSKMLEDEESAEIVKTITTLAKNLGKETIAEGVETRAHFEALRRLGVDQVQGFFVAPPLPGGEVEAILERIEGTNNHMERILAERSVG